MKLFHGTSLNHLDNILANGLLPTKDTNQTSNWEVVSAPDRVYLSDTYPLYFAIHAAMENNTDAVLIELEVDKDTLLPDEDYLAQATKIDDMDLIQLTEYYRDGLFSFYNETMLKELADMSLNNLGTVCSPAISPNNITGYAVIPNKLLVDMVLEHCDPTITIMNHRFLSDTYKQNLERVFNEHIKKQD